MTAVALIPLSPWLAASLIALTGRDYNTFIAWLKAPSVTVLMVLFLIALCRHMALGLRVVVEDYVHSDWVKIPAVLTIHLPVSRSPWSVSSLPCASLLTAEPRKRGNQEAATGTSHTI
ncbi:MAG: succinate dehydrogenase, hydrophobic membrane anchor protein [Burkholderiales bacterium]